MTLDHNIPRVTSHQTMVDILSYAKPCIEW